MSKESPFRGSLDLCGRVIFAGERALVSDVPPAPNQVGFLPPPKKIMPNGSGSPDKGCLDADFV